MIDALELKMQNNIKNQLVVKCKNFQIFQIDFTNPNVCQSINKSLDLLSNLSKNNFNFSRNKEILILVFNIASENMKFPFFNQSNITKKENEFNYWSLSPIEEYFKSCFSNIDKSTMDSISSEWRITDINKDYTVTILAHFVLNVE
jgi:hypothetical protein